MEPEKGEIHETYKKIELNDREEKRKDWHEKTKHFLAGIILIGIIIYLYVVLIFFKPEDIPDIFKYFIGFGSTVVAYYFFNH